MRHELFRSQSGTRNTLKATPPGSAGQRTADRGQRAHVAAQCVGETGAAVRVGAVDGAARAECAARDDQHLHARRAARGDGEDGSCARLTQARGWDGGRRARARSHSAQSARSHGRNTSAAAAHTCAPMHGGHACAGTAVGASPGIRYSALSVVSDCTGRRRHAFQNRYVTPGQRISAPSPHRHSEFAVGRAGGRRRAHSGLWPSRMSPQRQCTTIAPAARAAPIALRRDCASAPTSPATPSAEADAAAAPRISWRVR